MASRADDLFRFLTSVMAQDPGQARRFMGTLDKAAEARLAAAAEAGDSRAILKEFADAQIWGGKPKAPQLNERRATREPISGREWSARPDSYVNRKARLMANSDALPADLAARVLAGDVDAMQDAVRRSVVTPRAGRPKKAEDAIRELAKPADQVAAENIAGQFERATARPFADDAARQAELPFGPEEVSSPEVVINGPAARAADEARLQEYMDGPAARPRPASTLADDMTFDEVPARPRKPRVEPNDDAYRRAAYAAGAAGAAGGAYLLSRGGEEPALTGSGNPAELQDEDPISGSALAFSDEVGMGLPASDLTRSIGQPAQADHSVEYLKRMRELNRMDRTGVPTPEERAMQAEVRRLGDLATQQRRESGYSFPANHPTARLRNEAMRFPIGSPERDRLNAQADAVENAVVTGRTPWDFESTPEDPWAELNGPVAEPVRQEPPVVPRPVQRSVAPKPAARPPADLTETGNPAELVPNPIGPAQARVDAAVEDAINPPPPAQEPPMPASQPRRRNAEQPSQQAANDAAATPLTPDTELRDKPAAAKDYRQRLIAAGYTPAQADQIIAFESTQAGGLRPQDVSDDALRAKAARSNATLNRWDAQRDAYFEATGGNYQGPASPRSTVTVDGFTLPSVMGADGQPLGDGQYYTMRSLREAQDAKAEERRVAQIQASSQQEHDQFGSLHPDATTLVRHATDSQGRPLYRTADGGVTTDRFSGEPIIERTPSQDLHGYGMEYGPDHKPATRFDTKSDMEQVERWQDNVVARREGEQRTRQSPGYARAQARRFAESTGLPVAEVEAALATPGGRARLDAMAQDRSIAKDQAAKNRFARNARMVGGSQNLNPVTRSRIGTMDELGNPQLTDWQRMVMAETMLNEPQRVTPLAVEAQNMANSADIVRRFMTSGAAGMMDPQGAAEARETQLDGLPPQQQAVVSIRRGEPMGTGRSAAHVNTQWNYWMNNFGWRPESWREANFRSEMESLGYRPGQIDAWIDERRNAGGGVPAEPAAAAE